MVQAVAAIVSLSLALERCWRGNVAAKTLAIVEKSSLGCRLSALAIEPSRTAAMQTREIEEKRQNFLLNMCINLSVQNQKKAGNNA